MMRAKKSQRGAQAAALVVAVAIAAIAAAIGFWLGARQAPPPTAARSAMTGQAAGDARPAAEVSPRKILYWHDPMVPGQKFDKPGKSPYMDMELVPVYADPQPDGSAGAEPGSVSISPRVVQNFGVRTAVASEGTLASGLSTSGTVGVDERLIVAVQARSAGYVEKLHVRAQYDAVTLGQPLVDLYVPEWLAAEEELLMLKASAQPGAAALVDAARSRLSLLGVPATEIARVERDARASPRVTVTAPAAGIAWEIGARDGMAVTPGTTLFKLAALDTVWVTADVPEAQAALVRVGGAVEARAAGYPGRVLKGTVSAILPELNAATRTVRARIVLGNPGAVLKPGMYATVTFGGEPGKVAVLVPAEAVIRTGKRDVVIVEVATGQFRPVEVELGRDSGNLVEVRKGIAPGQHVVVSGQFLVDSEASLKSALARLASGVPEATMGSMGAAAPAPDAGSAAMPSAPNAMTQATGRKQ